MALIEQVRGMRIAEVKLVIEVDASRHYVFRKRVGSLKSQSVAKTSLRLNEQRIVVVDAGRDQRVDLLESGGDVPLGQKAGVQIWTHDRLTANALTRVLYSGWAESI